VKQLLIVYHSQSGGAERLAEALIAGARDPAIETVTVNVRTALEASTADVRAATAIILGTPENFGYMSGALKYFFDRIYYPCLDHTQGLPYALFIKASQDGQGARTSVERIVTGLRWRAVQPPLIAVGEVSPAHLAAAREMGLTLAAGLDAGLY